MPELGEDVYEEDELRGDYGPEEIRRYAKLDHHIVIGNGCSWVSRHWRKPSWTRDARCISDRMTTRKAPRRLCSFCVSATR